MAFLLKIEHFLFLLSMKVPLEIFIFLGSFIEEIIPPIPSSLVTISAGGILAARNLPWGWVLWLSLFGALGKVIAASILYWVSFKTQFILVDRFGKYVGLSHKDIQSLSKKFGKGWKDDVTLFVLRALPFVPSFTVSVGAGILKLHFRTFVITTILGTIVRDAIFIGLGYMGLDVYKKVSPYIYQTESLVWIVIAISMLGIGYFLYNRKKSK